MMKTTQAMRKMMLPARPRMSPPLRAEAMKKPAHTRKRDQPQRWNLLSQFLLSADIAIASHNLVIIKGATSFPNL